MQAHRRKRHVSKPMLHALPKLHPDAIAWQKWIESEEGITCSLQSISNT